MLPHAFLIVFVFSFDKLNLFARLHYIIAWKELFTLVYAKHVTGYQQQLLQQQQKQQYYCWSRKNDQTSSRYQFEK